MTKMFDFRRKTNRERPPLRDGDGGDGGGQAPNDPPPNARRKQITRDANPSLWLFLSLLNEQILLFEPLTARNLYLPSLYMNLRI